MTTTQELPALRYDGLYEYAQAHRLDYNELCAVARAALAAQVEPPGTVLIRLHRPEGYEDVHPELVLADANINPAFEPELVPDCMQEFAPDLAKPYRMHDSAKLPTTGVKGPGHG